MLGTVLMCLAFVFLLFAAFSWPTADGAGRVRWGWLGMVCWCASILFSGPLSAMFRVLAVVSIAVGLLSMATPASATHYVVAAAAAVTTGSPSAPSAAAGGGSAGAACVAGCALVAGGIVVIFVLIVADKVKRIMAGPACATGKMRQSWFGMVKDDPELWLPKCPRQRTVVSVRG